MKFIQRRIVMDITKIEDNTKKEDDRKYPEVQKFRKGDVFFVYEQPWISGQKINGNSHTMAKTRPYVVISGDSVLKSNPPILQMVPITSSVDLTRMDDVIYKDSYGKFSRVVTNQIFTIDVNDIRQYLYHLNDEIILDIDRSIASGLGIADAIVKMAFEAAALEDKIKKAKASAVEFIEEQMKTTKTKTKKVTKPKEKTKETTEEEIEEIIEEVASDNKETVAEPKEEVKDEPKEDDTAIINEEDLKKEPTHDEPETKPKRRIGRAPIEESWSMETITEFMKAYNSELLSNTEVGEMFRISGATVPRVYKRLLKQCCT